MTAEKNVSRKLIEAQEEERKRIARELHDDIGQRLAMLTVELDLLSQDPGIPDIRIHLAKLQNQASEITNDVQTLSHELHSTKLDYLSPTAAMKSLCHDIAQQTKVQIGFESHNVPSLLPAGVSLCLYRVLQEALRNSAKHSGTKQAEVRFWGTANEIHLTVSDYGAGFDIDVG